MSRLFVPQITIKMVFLLLAILSAGCTPVVHERGWIPQRCLLDQVKPGVSTKEQVSCTLGTPTLVSTFGDETWYYVARVTKSQTSFTRPTLLENDVYAFSFGPEGRLRCLEILSKDKIQKITPVSRETDTKGYNVSVFKQMFKNLGRVSAGGAKH